MLPDPVIAMSNESKHPEDAEKIIAYLAQVGGETDYLSFGKEGLTISTERGREIYTEYK